MLTALAFEAFIQHFFRSQTSYLANTANLSTLQAQAQSANQGLKCSGPDSATPYSSVFLQLLFDGCLEIFHRQLRCYTESNPDLVWIYISVKLRAKFDPVGSFYSSIDPRQESVVCNFNRPVNVIINLGWAIHKQFNISCVYFYSKYFQ